MKKYTGITRNGHISEYVDWFEAFNQAGLKSALNTEIERKSPYTQTIWPAGNYYYSPLNSTHLIHHFTFDYLKRHKIILARDGIIPLLWYFNKFKSPGVFGGKILVHESALEIIPEPWQRRVGVYRLFSKEKFSPKTTKALLLTGLVCEYFVSKEGLEERLEKLVRLIGPKEMASLEKICVFHQRAGGHNSDYVADFFIKICAKLGLKNLTTMTTNLIESITSLHGHAVIEFNERKICADNYAVHSFLRRGAALLDLDKPKNSSYEKIAFSPYHGVEVCFKPKFPKAVDARPLKEKYLLSPTNVKIPWQDWLK